MPLELTIHPKELPVFSPLLHSMLLVQTKMFRNIREKNFLGSLCSCAKCQEGSTGDSPPPLNLILTSLSLAHFSSTPHFSLILIHFWTWKDTSGSVSHPVRCLCFFLFVCLFFGCPVAYGALGPGIGSEPQPQTKAQLQQRQILILLCWGRGSNPCPSAPKMLRLLDPVAPQQELPCAGYF